jgi:TonB family protein
MNTLLIYLLKSSVCLGILYILYWAFLRKETFFALNRFYLLMAGFLSLVIPGIPFQGIGGGTIDSIALLLDPVTVTIGKIKATAPGGSGGSEILSIIYFAGAALVLASFTIRIRQLVIVIRRSKTRIAPGHRLVITDGDLSPFSFFRWIFLNENSMVHQDIGTILAHEQVHMRQRHSIDLLFTEILKIVQWFNPFSWLTARELKNIHEYLADEGVIGNGIALPQYQQLILDESLGLRPVNLVSNFAVSRFKKRIIMMTKKRSGTWSMGKMLLALPVILTTWLVFSANGNFGSVKEDNAMAVSPVNGMNSTAPDTSEKMIRGKTASPAMGQYVPGPGDQQPVFPGGDDARTKFMLENIKYPEAAIKDKAEGIVYVTFTVEKDGSVTNAKVMRGFRLDCDTEALRVVKSMPKWIPGKVKGETAAMSMVLPVKFALSKEKPGEKKK